MKAAPSVVKMLAPIDHGMAEATSWASAITDVHQNNGDVDVHVCLCVYLCVDLYIYMCVCACVRERERVCVCIYIDACIYVEVCCFVYVSSYLLIYLGYHEITYFFIHLKLKFKCFGPLPIWCPNSWQEDILKNT
jgi:hypothetical protein